MESGLRLRGFIALLIGVALSAGVLLSFPSGTRPAAVTVSDLVAASDLVILADVINVSPAAGAAFTGSGIPLVARLSVRRVWKGEATGMIEASFGARVGRPSRPDGTIGPRIIAFLRREGSGWIALHAASVTPRSEAADPLEVVTRTAARTGSVLRQEGAGGRHG